MDGCFLRNSQLLPGYRHGQKARLLTRAALALLCAVSWISPLSAVYAQESDLRGTTNDTNPDDDKLNRANPIVKKGFKQSKSASQEAARQIERYQPTDLDPVAQTLNADNVQAPTSAASADGGQASLQNDIDNSDLIAPNDNVLPQESDTSTTNERGQSDDTPTPTSRPAETRTTQLDAETPEPFTRQSSDGALQNDDVGRVEPENERTGSIEGKDVASETDPYAAPGIRTGTFIMRPTFEAGVRSSNFPGDETNASAESRLLVRAESDWLRHALNIEADVNLRKAFSGGDDLQSGLRLAVDGRSDVTQDDEITASASFERAREAFDTSSSTRFSERPMVSSLRGTVGYTHDAGLVSLGGTLAVTRQTFGDGVDPAGAAIIQNDRDFTNITGTMRASYELSPVYRPFLEAEIGRRQFDNEFDTAGIANSATRYALRMGSEIDFGEKLNGELAAGWFVENVDDVSLENVSGFDLRGVINWSPERGTNVALALGTEVQGARSSTSSTSVLYSSSATITRRMRANLDASASLSASLRDFQGSQASQNTFIAEAGATWWFNRFTGIKGSVQHSATLSSDAASKRSATGVYVGVVLRR
jgi:hypothetical protein